MNWELDCASLSGGGAGKRTENLSIGLPVCASLRPAPQGATDRFSVLFPLSLMTKAEPSFPNVVSCSFFLF